jgi:sialate O-acetylesterase
MKPLNRFFAIMTCCGLLLLAASSFGQVRLPYLISDGMVLQRDTKLNIWGWAKASEKVMVKFNGKSYKAITATDGKWNILMAAQKTGGPFTMEINASNHITINNILIGDVWFCSGQSNMVLPMERVKERYPDQIPNANYPQIRNFFIPTLSDVTRLHEDLPPGQWKEANPKNLAEFGAATWFFAKQIYNKYHVPIGLINSSVGGTPIQAWISENGIKQVPQYANRLNQLKDTVYLTNLLKSNLAKRRGNSIPKDQLDKGLNGTKKWYDITYIPDGWHKYWLPGYWADQGVRGLNGVVWFRKEIEIPANMTGIAAKLYMGRIIDADQLYVNGVLSGGTTYQYPPRRYALPANLLKPGKNIIVIRVVNTSGKGGFVPDKPYFLIAGDQKIDLRGDWLYKVGQAYPQMNTMGGDFSAQNEPTGLYNTMVAPVINYSVKGFLWYQGETNSGKPDEYTALMKALISDWRNKWHDEELPFLFAQLPNYMEMQYSPSESSWAELRDAQLKSLSVTKTGMAVTIDAGEWNDIHPLDKKDVGERLALLAEKLAYNDPDVVASGPIYQSDTIKGNKIVITFGSIGSGLMVKGGGELEQFAIAGSDKKFVWAKAVIEGPKVIVSSDDVTAPKYVRYAWADNPDGANLYNKEGLPASPFRTDSK